MRPIQPNPIPRTTQLTSQNNKKKSKLNKDSRKVYKQYKNGLNYRHQNLLKKHLFELASTPPAEQKSLYSRKIYPLITLAEKTLNKENAI